MSLLDNCNAIAFKFLSSVEIDHYGSNQHEFHGAQAFKNLFGYSRQHFNGTITYINSQGATSSHHTNLTWYDARENHPIRSEFRFYYTSQISNFSPRVDNILLLSKDTSGNVIIVIIDDDFIINAILDNINSFTPYHYQNGSSYYGILSPNHFLKELL